MISSSYNASMNQKLRIARINIGVSLVVLGLKFSGYYVSGSTAIFSDAVETLVNILTAVTALIVIHLVSMPADRNHPYGHGKLEFFSAAFEGGLIFFAAVAILIESIQSFISNQMVVAIPLGISFVFVASLLNLLMSIGLRRIGQREKSETLLASSVHLMTDVYTTAGVILGLLVVKITNLMWLDSVISGVIALYLVVEGYRIVRRSISGLTDEIDVKSLKELSDAIQKNIKPGIINIHNLRAIRSGRFHHIDAHLIIPEFWDVGKAHRVTHEFEKSVVSIYPYEGEFAFHLDPCARKYCASCDVNDCPVRQSPFVKKFSFDSLDLIKPVAEATAYISESLPVKM